jgi:3-(3-hydroxy-phenyl)propionate hydroxylase
METAGNNGAVPYSRLPRLRAQLEELHIKPKRGLRIRFFVKSRSSTTLVSGAVIAQGWARDSERAAQLSDDVRGQGRTLAGFGVAAAAVLPHATAAAFARAGGRVVQMGHWRQRLHLAPRDSWYHIEGGFLPEPVPVRSIAVLRPDKSIVDVAAINVNRIVRESHALLSNPVSAPTMQAEHVLRTVQLSVLQ